METTPETEVYQFNGREYVYDPSRRDETRAIPDITKAVPREGFCVWVEYENGEQGVADLEDLLDDGLYFGWRNLRYFETVHPQGDLLTWGSGEIDIAPESVYMRVTGADLDEIWPIRFLDVP